MSTSKIFIEIDLIFILFKVYTMSIWGGDKSKINPFTGKEYSKYALEQQEKMNNLPSGNQKIKDELFKLLDKKDIIIAEAETGAGKSTNIPMYLLKEYLIPKKIKLSGIMVTQPRTLNAENIASYVAKVLDVKIGEEVGYKFRHNNKTSDKTFLTFATDGTLVQELYHNDGQFKYDIVIIDEVHERSLNIDIILAFIRNYLKYSTLKKKCKFIITSATLDLPLLTKYFTTVGKIGHLKIPGRAYPVETNYLSEKIKGNYDNKLIERVQQIIKDYDEGDILVFVEAKSAILRLCYKLNKIFSNKELICLPLYRGVSEEEQELATDSKLYKKFAKRKIVISTNIAESGVTVDGILFVIDTGLRYVVSFEQRINVFKRDFITKDSAEQRKGRAGRTAPGKCYRLYTNEEYKHFPEHKLAEILLSNIDNILINLLNTNFIKSISDLSCFLGAMITPPNIKQIKNSLNYLFDIQILTKECNDMDKIKLNCRLEKSKVKKSCFTSIGKCAKELPLDLPLAITLLASNYYSVTNEIIVLVSMLTVDDNISKWFVEPNKYDKKEVKKYNKIIKKYYNKKSDLLTLYQLYLEYKKQTKKTLKKWLNKNYLNRFYFSNTMKNIKQIKRMYDKLDKTCYIKNVVSKSKNKEDNILYAFLHGYFNQLALKSKYNDRIYNPLVKRDNKLVKTKIDIQLIEKSNNFLEKIDNIIVYINHSKINDKDTLKGIINIDKKMLDILYLINKDYFGKDKLEI